VDPSYLELVRLGVKPATDAVIRNTLGVVDRQLASGQASGRYFWHRFNFDGYGEKQDGSPWDIGFPSNPTEVWANNTTIGRDWPIGEHGALRVWLASIAAGELTAHEHAELRWLTIDELDDVPWIPADRVVVERLAGMLRDRHINQS